MNKKTGKATPPTRERLLAVYKLLLECDEDSPMTRDDIVAALQEDYDFNAALGTITCDTAALEDAGLIKINGQKGTPMERRGSYGRFDNNYLKDWELKILLDSLGKCIFLSAADIENIKSKLWTMTGKTVRKLLQKNQTILPAEYYALPEPDGSYVFRDVYTRVLASINSERKISFKYGKLDCHKNFKISDHRVYTVNPYKIYYMDKFFYLLATFDSGKKIYPYRMDRIRDLHILDEKRKPYRNVKEDLEEYIANNTDNFIGEKKTYLTIKWRGKESSVSVLYDVFGLGNVRLISEEDMTFIVDIIENEGLYNNLLKVGPNIQVLAPLSIRNNLINRLQKYRDLYVFQKHIK